MDIIEEQLKKMADEYAAEFEPMFRKVARRAFIDGMLEMAKQTRQKLMEL